MQYMEGGGGLTPPPPLENEKKEVFRGNFNLFHLYFTNEIRGGGGIGIHETWKGVGGQARVHGTVPAKEIFIGK